MKKIITVDGNEACANTAYMFTEIAGIYPITPSSPMAEHIDEWSSNNRLNIFGDKVKVVEMQSEAGAAGFVHGALQSGALASTYTASQGLLLMIPNMYKIAGEMLPGVMHVAARSLSTHALSIFGDHQDVYATRQTGFCMLASSSVQDAGYLSAIAHLASLEASLPFLHFFDGFRTSHEINKIETLELEDYQDMLNWNKVNEFRAKALNPLKPNTRGTAQNDDIYFQAMEVRNKFYNEVPDIVNNYMEKLNKKADTNYKPFNYYGSKSAKKVIVAMGSVCETIKEVIDDLKEEIGLIEVHLYRPFSTKYLLNVLPETVERIAVLDRTKEFGSIGEPLYLDIVSALKDKNLEIVGGRYGLSSKNTTPAQIKAVYDMLDNPKHNFTIGINDDVTNLSLKLSDYKIKNSQEILIYGYGSDGMVSASKSLIKLIGDNTDKDVQGYFQYDSKKSGGVTVSHLRISDKEIRSAYYVENPSIVVVSKDNYLNDFELLNSIEENGIFIINSEKSNDELIDIMDNKLKQILIDNHVQIYVLNAYDIAKKNGLANKISMIMESAIFYITNLVDYNMAKDKMIDYIKHKFNKKGNDVVEANINSLSDVVNGIRRLELTGSVNIIDKQYELYEAMFKRKGNELPVSAFLEMASGTFKAGTSDYEKRCISSLVPSWISSNCTTCNMCATVCPHGVIRPFLINDEEYNQLPSIIKDRCIKALGTPYYYIVSASIADCTGCGLCIKNCPGKLNNKALMFENINNLKQEQEIFNYLSKNITKKEIDVNNIRNSQFKEPKIKYCGACAGCGEPTYIKLLTQLFGDNLIISNATGCSSIYGGSAPSMPYTLPWASSLFEDNAEYGYGMLIANNTIRNRIKQIMENNLDNSNSELFQKWLDNYDDYKITKEVYNNLNDNIPEELKPLKDYIISRNIWCVGGDGWAYDIGFGGIDHVLSSNDNINILVLDTQIYSNTGGQSSKATPVGSIASFATSGKKTSKKDLARIAMAYPNCYVAQVSLGANPLQVLKALKEAGVHNGPSIVIAYCPCISHGIKGGMSNSIEMEKEATKCGYFPTFRYSPVTGFKLDSKDVDFTLFNDFLDKQTRYTALEKVNKDNKDALYEQNKIDAIKRYEYYKSLDSKE
ncbi:MAG: pyruvate:ferredoxin (flavodoxin) oxidoreductase [Bacilli bacterium]|nr:pyruvate:ferredoxin (flavodoxin) oxidoreductase [Bacilli bacterium]